MIKNVGYIGYIECDNCTKVVYINDPSQLTIWYHPDDPRPLAEADCRKCGHRVQDRISYDHFVNFRNRGCAVKEFGDKFSKLTEEDIDGWDFDADFSLNF